MGSVHRHTGRTRLSLPSPFSLPYLQHAILLQQRIPTFLKSDLPQQRLVVPPPKAVQGLPFWCEHALAAVVAAAAAAAAVGRRRKRAVFDQRALQAGQGPILLHLFLMRPFRQMQHAQPQLNLKIVRKR
jgi:hypothetical protein